LIAIAALTPLGCKGPEDDPIGSAEEAIITIVVPDAEEAPGPQGHTLRLNRPARGFDVLPSPDNEANGAIFTAPCGWIDLEMDGAVINGAIGYYVNGTPKFTFSNVLAMGKHGYKAFLRPSPSASFCVHPVQYFPRVYETGTLTVTLENTSSGPFSNRCADCPAWCDPSHHLYAKMTAKFPGKCGEIVGPPNPCAGKDDGWWCTPNRQARIFCDNYSPSSDPVHALQPCPCVERSNSNDVCAEEKPAVLLHEGVTLIQGELLDADKTQRPYAIAFVDLMSSTIEIKSTFCTLDGKSPAPSSNPASVSFKNTKGKEKNNPGVPYCQEMASLGAVPQALVTINTAPYAPNNNIPPWNDAPWWPTKTLAANGEWYRFGNDWKILLRADGGTYQDDKSTPAQAVGWKHAIGSTIPLIEAGRWAYDTPFKTGIAEVDGGNRRTAVALAGGGRYLLLFTSDGEIGLHDKGLSGFDAAALLLAARQVDGTYLSASDAILVDGGHATQMYAPNLIIGEAYSVLAGLSVVAK
jgi:hypothetical protein